MNNGKKRGDIPDLLYPSPEKRDALNKRRIMLNEKYPCTYIDDLMTDYLSGVICHHNPNSVTRLFRELCDDRETADYRLDALEDVMNNPKLSPSLHKISRVLLDSEHKGTSTMSSPDSFIALNGCIEALDGYIGCMNDLHRLYEEIGEGIRSEAFGKLFAELEERYHSEDFAQMKQDTEELKDALLKKIRSVTVAINFNEEMRPVSAGVVDFSEKPVGEKPNVFDRLFYKNAAHPDVYVKGKMRSAQPDSDGYVSEADKALFEAVEKLTSSYMQKLRSALQAYDRLSFDRISGMEDQLEIYDGLARIVEAAQARGLKMSRPVFCDNVRNAHIKGLFDPCFFFKAAAANTKAAGDELVVRNDLDMDDRGRFYILTGANNGGKTTFVRGAGLCFLMARTGFYVPAESCECGLGGFIFTHFPKEEETGINASRFTTEIKDFKLISDLADEESLLLMNESIQSTTPAECAEIAEELTKIFCIIGVRGIFATHITELALRCGDIAADPDCRSLPVSIVARVDENSGKRLYRIVRGEPSKCSYAADIFRSFGISADEIRKRNRQTS